MIEKTVTPLIKYMVVVFCIQDTGVFPIKISLMVPPPIEVTNAIIKMPNRSNFLLIAVNDPDITKATVPRISKVVKTVMLLFASKISYYFFS